MSTNPEPRIETVVLQPTPFCNIDCRYCYLPDRTDHTVMKRETVTAVFERIFSSGWASNYLTVIWHAGEPMVLPVSYYETAFSAIEALRPPALTIHHAIQTNGMLLTPEWCTFVKQWDVGLGVSIDGPRELHDANRVTRSGKGTFDRTLAGVRLLRREGVPFHVISVLSSQSMGTAKELLDFYEAEGIEDVCFNVDESEGAHVSPLLTDGGARADFHVFLEQFWILSRRTCRVRFIREIDGMLSRVFRPDGTTVHNEQVEPFAMINVDCRGNVSSFSPELLGLKHPDYNDFIIGNVHTDTLQVMRESAAMRAMTRDIAAGVAKCEQECGYFSVCGGGSPINKLSENGTFASTRTAFCSLVHMVPTDLILGALDRLERGLDEGLGLPLPPAATADGRHEAAPAWAPATVRARPATEGGRGKKINIPIRSQ